MELGNPTALSWGLLSIPIVIFYILKIRLRRQSVSTLMFWDQIFEESRPRSIWQRLRHLLSLLLQLLFLFLLVGSLVDPMLSAGKLRGQRIVLVVDNSASMNATDASPTRLAEAKQQAGRLIRGLRFRDQMAVISAGAVPRVECGLTGHQKTLRQAVDSVPSTDGPTRVSAAVALGRRLLADHDNGKVVVLSDGCFAEASDLTRAKDVKLLTFGDKADNVGITQFQVRRSLLDSIGYQILVEVTNFSDEAVQCRLDLDLNDNPVDVQPLQLEPGESWSKVIDQTSAEGGQLVAQLDHEDVLAADNRAVALLPRREMLPVLLVTEGNLFLQRVFEAIPIVRLTMTDTMPKSIPKGTLVVYHRELPAKLPPGNVLVIDPAGPCDLFTIGPTLQNPIVTQQDADSPLMTHVRLDNVIMPEAKELSFEHEPQVLASSISGDPLFCIVPRPATSESAAGKVLVLTVNLAKGDLPLRTAFPIMITNAVRWYQGTAGELREAVSSGRMTDVDLSPLLTGRSTQPDSAEASLVLHAPDGTMRPLPGGVTRMTIGPLDRCGVWRVERAAGAKVAAAGDEQNGGPVLEFACNLASRSESELRPAEDVASLETGDSSFNLLRGWPIWFYLAALAVLLTVAEWYLYQRRWIS